MESITATPLYTTNTSDVIHNGNDDKYYEDENDTLGQSLKILSLIVYCLAFVLGVGGNGVVIWVTGFRIEKTVNTVWILNLAVADFLFTAFLPLGVTSIALNYHWPFGNFMCRLSALISSLNMFASVYILVVISVDRCVSVYCPVWAQNHRRVFKASRVSLAVWILALIFSAPYFVFRDTVSVNDGITFCLNNFAISDVYETPSVIQLRQFRQKSMTISHVLLGFAIPFTVIVSCYAMVIHRLRSNRTLLRHSSRPFKIVAAVITTFFVCWAPYHIIVVIDLVNLSYQSQALARAIEIGAHLAISLAFLNSCINPLLYVFMGQDLKEKVCKSIPNVLALAFREQEIQSESQHSTLRTLTVSSKY